MSDAHEKLTAEYEALARAHVTNEWAPSEGDMMVAIRHILRRLGPPSLTEASEIEWREAIAADGARE